MNEEERMTFPVLESGSEEKGGLAFGDFRKYHLQFFGKAGVREEFPRKTVIMTEDRHGKYVHLIVSGRVRQYFINHDGAERAILLLSEGDLFGEVTAFRMDMDQVITETLTPVTVRRMQVDDFFKMLNCSDKIVFSFSLMFSNKMRIMMAQIQDSSFCTVEERLKNLLLRLSVQQGVPTPDGILIPHKYSQEEIAGMISSSRSTVSRKMKLLAEEEFIFIKDKYIYLKKEQA